MKRKALLGLLFLAAGACADESPSALLTDPRPGDCVIFREGGVGVVLKTPTYWLRGKVVAVARERRLAALCPDIGKPLSAYTRDDWVRLAAVVPCVEDLADVREVQGVRVSVAVEEWETPWSNQHGMARWLFRGQFLNQVLRKSGIMEMDSAWLQKCESR